MKCWLWFSFFLQRNYTSALTSAIFVFHICYIFHYVLHLHFFIHRQCWLATLLNFLPSTARCVDITWVCISCVYILRVRILCVQLMRCNLIHELCICSHVCIYYVCVYFVCISCTCVDIYIYVKICMYMYILASAQCVLLYLYMYLCTYTPIFLKILMYSC